MGLNIQSKQLQYLDGSTQTLAGLKRAQVREKALHDACIETEQTGLLSTTHLFILRSQQRRQFSSSLDHIAATRLRMILR